MAAATRAVAAATRAVAGARAVAANRASAGPQSPGRAVQAADRWTPPSESARRAAPVTTARVAAKVRVERPRAEKGAADSVPAAASGCLAWTVAREAPDKPPPAGAAPLRPRELAGARRAVPASSFGLGLAPSGDRAAHQRLAGRRAGGAVAVERPGRRGIPRGPGERGGGRGGLARGGRGGRGCTDRGGAARPGGRAGAGNCRHRDRRGGERLPCESPPTRRNAPPRPPGRPRARARLSRTRPLARRGALSWRRRARRRPRTRPVTISGRSRPRAPRSPGPTGSGA